MYEKFNQFMNFYFVINLNIGTYLAYKVFKLDYLSFPVSTFKPLPFKLIIRNLAVKTRSFKTF